MMADVLTTTDISIGQANEPRPPGYGTLRRDESGRGRSIWSAPECRYCRLRMSSVPSLAATPGFAVTRTVGVHSANWSELGRTGSNRVVQGRTGFFLAKRVQNWSAQGRFQNANRFATNIMTITYDRPTFFGILKPKRFAKKAPLRVAAKQRASPGTKCTPRGISKKECNVPFPGASTIWTQVGPGSTYGK